jgi:aminotransferase
VRDYGARRERMLATLGENGFRAHAPEGAYYVLTDLGPLAQLGDDHRVARHMTREVGVAVVPGSSFYGTPGLGHDAIRWAFAKRLETLDAVAERLRARLSRA